MRKDATLSLTVEAGGKGPGGWTFRLQTATGRIAISGDGYANEGKARAAGHCEGRMWGYLVAEPTSGGRA